MKVSIITPSYNNGSTLEDTILSVYNQKYDNIEHIIIDGDSDDKTLPILKKFSTVIDKFVSEPDDGIYDAMNKGIQASTGEVIGILNADDFYTDKNVIEDIVNLFHQEECEGCYADLNYVNPSDTNKIVRHWEAGEYQDNYFYKGWMPPHPTFFVKREVYNKYGLFNLELGTAADYEIMLRFIHKHNIDLAYLPRPIIKMRTGGASNASILNRLMASKNDRKAWRVNDLEPKAYTLLLKPLRKITQFKFSLFS